MPALPTIDTTQLSEKHDQIFNKTIGGLGSARTKLLGLGEKFTEKTSSVSVLEKLPPADGVINKSFDLVEKGLTKQHDWVEGLLAKKRSDEATEAEVVETVADVVDEAPEAVESVPAE